MARPKRTQDEGGILAWCAFGGPIAIDCVRTCGTLLTEARARRSMSLLGLDDEGFCHMDRRTAEMSPLFVTAGVVASARGNASVVTAPVWFEPAVGLPVQLSRLRVPVVPLDIAVDRRPFATDVPVGLSSAAQTVRPPTRASKDARWSRARPVLARTPPSHAGPFPRQTSKLPVG